jgi:hypothetical protein
VWDIWEDMLEHKVYCTNGYCGHDKEAHFLEQHWCFTCKTTGKAHPCQHFKYEPFQRPDGNDDYVV